MQKSAKNLFIGIIFVVFLWKRKQIIEYNEKNIRIFDFCIGDYHKRML